MQGMETTIVFLNRVANELNRMASETNSTCLSRQLIAQANECRQQSVQLCQTSAWMLERIVNADRCISDFTLAMEMLNDTKLSFP
jgi:hypothetical protein